MIKGSDKGAAKAAIPMKEILGWVVLWLVLLTSPGWALDGADKWRDLSPKERENVLRNYQRWQNLPPRDKEHLQEEWDRWRRLPPEQRDKLRKRYDDLYNRSPDEKRNPRDDRNKRSRRPNDRNDD